MPGGRNSRAVFLEITVSKQRKIANTPVDPTLPTSTVNIDGVDYVLTFDMGALAEAENQFQAEGKECNLLFALPNLDLASIRVLFPCAIRKFQPHIAFDEAQKLITFRSLGTVLSAVADAWSESKPDPEEEALPLDADANEAPIQNEN
jgi:hypothetical protein